MRAPQLVALAASSALALGAAACGGSDDKKSTSGGSGGQSSTSGGSQAKLSGSISGAGATFPKPVYEQWANEIQKQGLTVNYNGIGSGGGVAQFTAGTVDFGATDSAMKPEELTAAKKKGQPVHVPTVFGAVTVSYNLPGVAKGLKLDGATVADIFLGKIKKWNSPRIAGLNPGVDLPDQSITVVHRSDESGTTKLFTTFLSDYSPTWEKSVGSEKTVKWPTGTGAKGNDGVAAAVKQTQGSVGYVEEAYALANNFTTANLKNKAGQFVEPNLASTSAAGQGLKVPADLRFDAINAPGAKAYPIASATFIVVYRDLCRAGLAPAKATGVKGFLDYALGDGQKVAPQIQYAPLPAPLRQRAQAKVDGLTCNGKPVAA